MFRAIVMSACVAGLGAGIVLTLVQQPTVAPIILAAEVYESAPSSAMAPSPASSAAASQSADRASVPHAGTSATHNDTPDEAHDNAWAPVDGFERTFWTLVSNVGVGIGFALLLCAVYTLSPGVSAARGVLWGLAGFVVFFANPGIGLRPEIPGTMSADLFDRQLWWSFTALCSAGAVALIVWRRAIGSWGGAAALLVLPHLLGAPEPAVHGGLAPPALAQQFIWASTFVNAVFWLTLGVLSALAFRRLATPVLAAAAVAESNL